MIEYSRELGDVLRTFDVSKFRQFVLDHLDLYLPSLVTIDRLTDDKFVKGCMAKMILARTDMPVELMCKAKKVLDEMRWDYEIY